MSLPDNQNAAYHLVFSGSGARFISFVGALRSLEDSSFPHLTKNVRSVTGSSGGALIGTAVALGYNLSFIEKLCMSMRLSDMTNVDVNGFLTDYGLDNGFSFIRLFKNLIVRKLGHPDATFKDLHTSTGRVLNITATNITKMSSEVFNHVSQPDMPIWTALRITMSIPLLFTAVKYKGSYFVDGAILNSFPVTACLQGPGTVKRDDIIIAINLKFTVCDNEITDIVSYIKALTKTFSNRLHVSDYNNLRRVQNLIIIKVQTAHRSAFDLDISAPARAELTALAYEQTRLFMTSSHVIVRLMVKRIFDKLRLT